MKVLSATSLSWVYGGEPNRRIMSEAASLHVTGYFFRMRRVSQFQPTPQGALFQTALLKTEFRFPIDGGSTGIGPFNFPEDGFSTTPGIHFPD
jgi:hypothetical protein